MYSDTERRIFGPYDRAGDGSVNYADPLRIHRRLVHSLEGEPDVTLAATRSEVEAVAFEATEKLLRAVVYAFELVPFDPATGKGVTEQDCLALLNHWCDWQSKKNASAASSPTGSAPTASAPAQSITPPSAGSTGTSSDCGCNKR